MAARFGHLETVKFHHSIMGDINVKCNHNSTALLLACEFGHLELVDFLLTINIQVDGFDNDIEY